MSEMITVGDAIARTLEQYQVEAIYGVISIPNPAVRGCGWAAGQYPLCARPR